MTTDLDRQDAHARQRALDVRESFVVQAPAGSGKTGLLTQRLLALLAAAGVPEEILAITFTRKAAGEMRQRVIKALRDAEVGLEPKDGYARITHDLARRALARSAEQGWDLGEHPARLRIQTIDSLSQSLARALPILSRAGAGLEVAKDAATLYDEAALRLLAELEEGGETERNLAIVLEHFDNDFGAVRQHLSAMLERRDHWLQPILAADASATWRARLEETLARVADEALGHIAQLIPRELNETLWASVIRAARRLDRTDSGIAALASASEPAPPVAAQLGVWQTVARFLLTADGSKEADWRKALDKRMGFPTTHREDKQLHLALIQELQRVDGMLPGWRAVVRLPPVRYDDSQWRVLAALLAILKRLAAHLRVIFTERGLVDYAEVAIAAREALGPEDGPTDLALRLDYRIQHILVDEFQDTSRGQVELLKRLTAGWTGSDGRTLFCVGDPMQSIYRFRQAEVALFLKVQRHGIENLTPQTLTLARNFRSQAGIVEWVNGAFSRLLPAEDDFASGAVCYTPAQSTHPVTYVPAVRVWPQIGADLEREARCVVDIVRSSRERFPNAKIAVLARTRSHMRDIAVALRGAGIRFQAIEFETLGERRAVRDLAALTRALCHRDDRIAWYAVLRAPYCGLKLADLSVLGGAVRERTVWDLLVDPACLAKLSTDARERLARVVPVLVAALAEFGRVSLAALVEGTWLALGGPASVEAPADLDNARAFFERLALEERAGDLDDPARLDESLVDLHAAADTAATDALQLMTIHRAKGLEWDVVILPGLGRAPRSDRRRLLYSVEIESVQGQSGLILAPARAAASGSDALEAFVRQLEKDRTRLESARLLYVAATRAREELHLLGHIEETEAERKPAAASLLAILWPVVRADFDAASTTGERPGSPAVPKPRSMSSLRRVISGWQPPRVGRRLFETRRETGDEERELQPQFEWAGEIARLVGIVVHRDLERRVRTRITTGRALDVDLAGYRTELRELGVPEDRVAAAADRVVDTVARLLADERGRWILGPHRAESSEWALTAEVDGQVRRLVIDRSFIDEAGTRWIIDYKTGTHAGGAVEEFLTREEERYSSQLARYAEVVQRLGPEPIRTALYFPLLAAWRETGGSP